MTFGIEEVEYQEMYIHTSLAAFTAETGVTTGAGGGLETNVIMKGSEYLITAALQGTDAADVAGGAGAGDTFTATDTITADTTGRVEKTVGQLRYSTGEGMLTLDAGNPQTNLLTTVVQNVQAKINTARVQAGSQYAALESAVNYTTDLTAQYELGYNTVNDVNFSMETAHLAKNQILQQAATAMLAQANQGQQGLLQLIS